MGVKGRGRGRIGLAGDGGILLKYYTSVAGDGGILLKYYTSVAVKETSC